MNVIPHFAVKDEIESYGTGYTSGPYTLHDTQGEIIAHGHDDADLESAEGSTLKYFTEYLVSIGAITTSPHQPTHQKP